MVGRPHRRGAWACFRYPCDPGGPAEKAGIKAGDIVLAVDQKPVKGLADFLRQVWLLGPAGIKVPLKILQDTQINEISVQSADRYQYIQISRQR